MRVLGLIVFTSFLIAPDVFGQSIADCFQKNTKDGDLSICVSTLHAEKKATLEIMMKEFEDLIHNDLYLKKPEKPTELEDSALDDTGASELDYKKAFDPNNAAPKSDLEKEQERRLNDLTQDMRDLVNRPTNKVANRGDRKNRKNQAKETYEYDIRIYEIKKISTLQSLKDSDAKFEDYKNSECRRQSDAAKDNDRVFIEDITYKTCLYDMINHRIKMLQRSMAK